MNKKADCGGCNPLRSLICPIVHIILSVIVYIKIAEHRVISVFLSNFLSESPYLIKTEQLQPLGKQLTNFGIVSFCLVNKQIPCCRASFQ